jgi:UDP:flavonoid glycosyltransferase YjiC (YdhE family)
MVNPDPKKNSQILLDILESNKIPSIINTADGGLVQPDNLDIEFVYFVSQIPYEWIFPKIYGIIHHGGSGTTHLALKYGCASMIIPHIIDQFAWNGIIADLGAGPKGVKISNINTGNLEPRILDLMNKPSYKKRAEEIANQMSQEDLKDKLYETIIE